MIIEAFQPLDTCPVIRIWNCLVANTFYFLAKLAVSTVLYSLKSHPNLTKIFTSYEHLSGTVCKLMLSWHSALLISQVIAELPLHLSWEILARRYFSHFLTYTNINLSHTHIHPHIHLYKSPFPQVKPNIKFSQKIYI